MATRRVPVTLISGYAGAGKSTVVEQLRKKLRSRRAAFLQDPGDGDLYEEIERAVDMEGADLLVIECACHMEPFFVAEDLEVGTDDTPPPAGIRIDTAVTVIDASSFLRDCVNASDIGDVVEDCDLEDERTVAEILVEQVEFADVIIINKFDLVNGETLARTEALLERLNPRARRLVAIQGEVSPQELVGTGLFDMTETDEGAGWLAQLSGDFDGVGAIDGVTSFTYTERRPLHPIRFNELLADFDMPGLVRAKGSLWVASRHSEIGVWSLAGRASTLSYGGAWFAATPAREWPQSEQERADIMTEWVAPFGDRRQEIAFIGIDMDEGEIRDRLNECLLTAHEMKDGPDGWYLIPDPLPDWHVGPEVEY